MTSCSNEEPTPSTAEAAIENLTRELLDLPPELLHQIVADCDHEDLVAINRTCKTFHNISSQIIYHKVDLRVDVNNSDNDIESDYHNWVMHTERYESCLNRQIKFLQTMTANEAYHELVKDLRWTLFWPGSRHAYGMIAPHDGYDSMWKVFECLTGVEVLDLATFQVDQEICDRGCPLSLFPSVVRIKLSGPLNMSIVEAVLSNAHIRKLVLWHLQEQKETMSAYNTSVTSSSEPLNISRARGGIATWLCCGPMREVFPRIPALLTNLQELYIRRPAWIHELPDGFDSDAEEDVFYLEDDQVGPEIEDTEYPPSSDRRVYEDYGALIKGASQTLEILEFEQYSSERYCFEPGVLRRTAVRHWDRYFKAILWPILLHGPWPRLRIMRLIGLGPDNRFLRIVDDDELYELETAVGDATVDLEDTEFERGAGYFYIES